jgi:hypothetical protein
LTDDICDEQNLHCFTVLPSAIRASFELDRGCVEDQPQKATLYPRRISCRT